MGFNISCEADTMICVICKQGQTRPGNVTLTLERGELLLVVKAVPAQVCEVCCESYVDEAQQLNNRGNKRS